MATSAQEGLVLEVDGEFPWTETITGTATAGGEDFVTTLQYTCPNPPASAPARSPRAHPVLPDGKRPWLQRALPAM